MMSNSRTLVIIPTFNEAENLNRIMPDLLHLPVDILIVDDNSNDGTAQVAMKLNTFDNRITVLSRPEKLGLGSAYLAGYAFALNAGYELIIQMDADGSHRVEDLHAMMSALEPDSEIDLAIGSRWVKGGAVKNWAKNREVLSRVANRYSRFMLGLGVKDVTAGFRIYRASLLRRMNLQGISSQGYSFQIEMTREADSSGAHIQEIPITFIEREIGTSKMSSAIVREAMIKVTTWGFSRIVKKFTSSPSR